MISHTRTRKFVFLLQQKHVRPAAAGILYIPAHTCIPHIKPTVTVTSLHCRPWGSSAGYRSDSCVHLASSGVTGSWQGFVRVILGTT
jgi:hypothetical protein